MSDDDFPETADEHMRQMVRALEMMIDWGAKFADNEQCAEMDALLARAKEVAKGRALN